MKVFKPNQFPSNESSNLISQDKMKSNNDNVINGLIVNSLSNTSDHTEQINPLCLFLNTYYEGFLSSHYAKCPSLNSEPYIIQNKALTNECFGDSNFYSEGLTKAGWRAEDLIINCTPLQKAWARENNILSDGIELAIEQIRIKSPRVIYLQDIGWGSADFLSAIKPYTELIVGQIASPVPPQTDLSGFDIIFSSFPHFVKRFRDLGITSYYQPLAFAPHVLEKLQRNVNKFPVTFVGGISPAHGTGKEILEQVAELIPIDFWGYGAGCLPENSPILKRHHGECWGLDMFNTLHNSFITINRHIDSAENYANNMRLFEATGCGALLITDYKDNLNELFEIGKEIVAYRSPEECAELVKYYLANPDEALEIANAGQKRTLRDHTYTKRMAQTAEILSRHLQYNRDPNRFLPPDLSKISCGYKTIKQGDISEVLTNAWKNDKIPEKQRALVQNELSNMYKGKPPVVYQVLADSLLPYVLQGSAILEIGCASGYYYEVLEYLLNKRISYTGVDYSDPLISMANEYYPNTAFHVADGASLPFEDEQFQIAISSCILLHVQNYSKHIAETARVAKEYVVAHRTPVCRKRPTQYFKKLAYGVETVELRFNEETLLAKFESNGLKLINSIEYYSNPDKDDYELTYVFKKNEQFQPLINIKSISSGFDENSITFEFSEYEVSNQISNIRSLNRDEIIEKSKVRLRSDTVYAWSHKRILSFIDPILDAYTEAKWLTVGDGVWGFEAHYIESKGCKALATDISDDLLAEAKKIGYILEFKKENAEALSFKDNTFDFVLCKESYHHFPRPMIALYEMIRVSKKGVVLFEPFDQNGNNFERIGNYVYSITEREIEKVALGLGLGEIAFKGFNMSNIGPDIFEKADPLSDFFKNVLTKLDQKDSNSISGKQPYEMMVAIIFKEPVENTVRNNLSENGFRFKDLPINLICPKCSKQVQIHWQGAWECPCGNKLLYDCSIINKTGAFDIIESERESIECALKALKP